MKKYSFHIFLVCAKSADTISAALLNNEFSINLVLKSGRLCAPSPVSSLMAASLYHEETDLIKIKDKVLKIIKEKNIPYFGFYIGCDDGTGSYEMGYLPEVPKKKKPISTVPYNNVVSLNQKDDGIIED